MTTRTAILDGSKAPTTTFNGISADRRMMQWMARKEIHEQTGERFPLPLQKTRRHYRYLVEDAVAVRPYASIVSRIKAWFRL